MSVRTPYHFLSRVRATSLCLHLPQHLIECLDEKIIAPDHTLIDPESAMQMIHSAIQHTFGSWRAASQVLLAQRAQDPRRRRPVKMALHRIGHHPAES